MTNGAAPGPVTAVTCVPIVSREAAEEHAPEIN